VKGRCDGCGAAGPEKEIGDHIISCPDWARLYDKDPSAVLDPVPSYLRWHEQDRPRERQEALEGRVADVLGRRAALRDRYGRRPDPLEDL
jgi:hypothetical protein